MDSCEPKCCIHQKEAGKKIRTAVKAVLSPRIPQRGKSPKRVLRENSEKLIIHSSHTTDTERYCEPGLILSMSESTRMLAVAEMKHPSLVIEALCFVSTPMYFNPFASAARPMGPLLSIGHCVRSLCTRLNLFLISCPLSIIS